MKFRELKDQSTEQLTYMLEDLEKDLFKLMNELASARKLEKPHLVRQKRKEKAQILTLLTERSKKG